MKTGFDDFFYFSDSCRSGFVLDGKNSGSCRSQLRVQTSATVWCSQATMRVQSVIVC